MSYLYILKEDERSNYYKIGITKDAVEKRKNALETGNPRNLIIVAYFLVDNPRKVERIVHSIMGQYHIRREWFNAPEDEIDNLIRVIEQRYCNVSYQDQRYQYQDLSNR